jgi:hypothetical protein
MKSSPETNWLNYLNDHLFSKSSVRKFLKANEIVAKLTETEWSLFIM